MIDDHELSAAEERFCRAYVANGGNGTKAAIEAGYSERSASVAASRLLKRQAVKDRIRTIRDGPRGAVVAIMDAAADAARAAREGAWTDPNVIRAREEAEKDLLSGLNRAYVVAGLIDNFEMSLGRRSKRLTRMLTKRVKATDGTMTTTVEAVQVDVFEVDHAGANRAAELLLAQCGSEAPETSDAGGNSVTPLLDAYMEGRIFEVRPDQAKPTRK